VYWTYNDVWNRNCLPLECFEMFPPSCKYCAVLSTYG